jgi:hypothetical protein
MFKVKVKPGLIISIDSDHPDKFGEIQFEQIEGNDPIVIPAWKRRLSDMYGIHGNSIGDRTSPLDLNIGLRNNKVSFEILEGAEILKIPTKKLPEGSVW